MDKKRALSQSPPRAEKKTRRERTTQLLAPSPACPGVVKPCDEKTPLQCPPGSDLLEIFRCIRGSKSLTNEQAFLEFLESYKVTASAISDVILGKQIHLQQALLSTNIFLYSKQARCLLFKRKIHRRRRICWS